MAVKLTYDSEIDALYIQLQDASTVDSVDVEDGVTLDLDASGGVVGVEILDARSHLDSESDWPALILEHVEVC